MNERSGHVVTGVDGNSRARCGIDVDLLGHRPGYGLASNRRRRLALSYALNTTVIMSTRKPTIRVLAVKSTLLTVFVM